jgi:DNA modification methylase
MSSLATRLLSEFQDIVGNDLVLPEEYRQPYERLCEHLRARPLRTPPERRRWLIAHINRKFRFNADGTARLYAAAAAMGHTFNYHEKIAIQQAFDLSDRHAIDQVFATRAFPPSVLTRLSVEFMPVSEGATIRRFRDELSAPTKLRREKGARPIEREILLAAFSAFLFCVADAENLHQFFDRSYKAGEYEPSFWRQLRRMYPHLYNRDRTLDVVRVAEVATDESYESLRARTLSVVAESYRSLNNHGHLAVLVDPIVIADRFVSWELVADLILFAEKHVGVELKNAYFQHATIRAVTSAYITGLDAERARFHVADEGFTYRDTFVIAPSEAAPMGMTSMLVVLQKNARDETLIPCPACRSHDVQGNSYPSLGVRSWECRNALCPDRSKYNRGKRYAFRALLMQEAIDDERNEIEPESVRGWVRDVQFGRTAADVLAMLVRHYSLHGDTIRLFGSAWPQSGEELLGRTVLRLPLPRTAEPQARLDSFFQGPLFERYVVSKAGPTTHQPARVTHSGSMTVVQDDCFAFLAAQPADSFDGAVTSPPYYNAREYAQWDNIYCYMYDIFNLGVQLHRVLRPGALFLYNIFDSFDNERSVAFSAMGQKRMILSAYAVDAFRRAGFACAGNVAWDKGDIEGKRGFNAGNFSPYYQSPFNCWEHILVLRKPGGPRLDLGLPAVLQAKPVIKMIRGENTYGHTAPYPEEIPALLAAFVPPGGRVVDPFGGSATTARALCPRGIRVVCVERDENYCRLALEMGSGESQIPTAPPVRGQLHIFGSPTPPAS